MVRSIVSSSKPVNSATSAIGIVSLLSAKTFSERPKARRPSLPACFRSERLYPLSLIRATTRAWAAAWAVHLPLRTGTIFSSAHLVRVFLETPALRAASLRLIRSFLAMSHEATRAQKRGH